MATSLFKLVMSATTTTGTTTTTTTDSNPAVEKYFYKLQAAHRTSGTVTIPSTSFVDDAGSAVASFLTTATANNGYYLLFVNGNLQESALFTVGANGSQVVITKSSTVPVSAPITLVVNNFGPTSASNSTSTSTTTVTT